MTFSEYLYVNCKHARNYPEQAVRSMSVWPPRSSSYELYSIERHVKAIHVLHSFLHSTTGDFKLPLLGSVFHGIQHSSRFEAELVLPCIAVPFTVVHDDT